MQLSCCIRSVCARTQQAGTGKEQCKMGSPLVTVYCPAVCVVFCST